MFNVKIWGWNKKNRTLLRFIKPGNIFCFKYSESFYCFGRIMSKTIVGHVAEIFTYTSTEPVITENQILHSSRLIDVVILDSYSLFDCKSEGDWRIIGIQDNYQLVDAENIYFTYGAGKKRKMIDIDGNKSEIEEVEAQKYPILSPQGDYYIKKLISEKWNSERAKESTED